MTPKEFKKLPNRERWEASRKIKNVMWCCQYCGNEQGKARPKGMFLDGERYCSECNGLLTKRTPGGQSDPFNYTFKIIKKQ